jgi:hypothetical protein
MCSSPLNFSTNFFTESLSLEGDDDVAEVATGPENIYLNMHT